MRNQHTGATELLKALEAHGVEYIFGYSGGAVIPIFDALASEDTTIQLVLVRHEQGAAHMADGYARASGKPGVILVTSGPGAGNIVSGLMTAHMDSVPLIAITGQQIRSILGFDAFQEADTFNITMPVTKHNYLVKETNDIPRIVREAFHLATTGRPGPVLIDIPKDVSAGVFHGDAADPMAIPAYHATVALDTAGLDAIAERWQAAKRPLVLAGHGVLIAGAEQALVAVARATDTPVVTTLLGKGAIDETDDLALGMLGMHGTAYANKAVTACDFLLNVGSRFDDRIIGTVDTFCESAYIAHIDIDESEFGKLIQPDRTVRADAKQALDYLRTIIQPRRRRAWRTHNNRQKELFPLRYPADAGLSAQQIIQRVYEMTNGQAIVATDVGQHQMWAAQFYKISGRHQWLSSGGAGTMGFGMPAAIGAQLANPKRQVVAFVGDGGFQMTLYELATACIHKLPIKVVILNNHYLGMVRQWQELFYDNRESGVDMVGNPDFAALAESYGARGITIRSVEEVDEKLAEAFAISDRPVIINAEVAKTDNVFPMVPPGSPLSAMVIEPPTKPLTKPTGST